MCPMCVSVCAGQKRASDPLKLEIQVSVSHLMWVLGTKHGSSASAVSKCS